MVWTSGQCRRQPERPLSAMFTSSEHVSRVKRVVFRNEPIQLGFHGIRQRVVGGSLVGEFGFATFVRDVQRAQHRVFGWWTLE